MMQKVIRLYRLLCALILISFVSGIEAEAATHVHTDNCYVGHRHGSSEKAAISGSNELYVSTNDGVTYDSNGNNEKPYRLYSLHCQKCNREIFNIHTSWTYTNPDSIP